MTIIEIFNRLTFGRAMIAGFILTACYYFFIFDNGEMQNAAIRNAESQLISVQNEILSVQAKLDQAHQYQNASQTLGKSIDRLLEVIPSGFRIDGFMKTASVEARLAGLQIASLSPTPNVNTESVPEFSELGVSIGVRGQYSQILKFMASLTQKKQIFIYKSIKMVTDSTSGAGNGLILMTADLRAYNYIGHEKSSPNGAQSGAN